MGRCLLTWDLILDRICCGIGGGMIADRILLSLDRVWDRCSRSWIGFSDFEYDLGYAYVDRVLDSGPFFS